MIFSLAPVPLPARRIAARGEETRSASAPRPTAHTRAFGALMALPTRPGGPRPGRGPRSWQQRRARAAPGAAAPSPAPLPPPPPAAAALASGAAAALLRAHLLSARARAHTLRPRAAAADADAADTPLASTSAVVPAAPAGAAEHPRALRLLYALYLASCLTERTWRFGLPLVLAYMPGGLRAIALVGFVAPLAVAVAGPAAGRALDAAPRPAGLAAAVAAQGAAIAASALVLLAASTAAVRRGAAAGLAGGASAGGLALGGAFFAALLALSAAERLSAVVAELAIERDWVTRLAGRRNSAALAASNAWLRRADLACELVGALLFGAAFSAGGPAPALAGAFAIAAVCTPLQLWCIRRIAAVAPAALARPPPDDDTASAAPAAVSVAPPLGARLAARLALAAEGWRAYARQPVLSSSLAWICLFLNVAMSPGGLITGTLAAWGLDGGAMAAFRGGCAAMGFAGTALGRRLIERHGLLGAGRRALAAQGALLGTAAAVYFAALAAPLPAAAAAAAAGAARPAVVAFAALVVASRAAVWCLDMTNAQLFQQAVAPADISAASSAEMALCMTAELVMLGLVATAAVPYAAVVGVSLGAVLAANVVFGRWAGTAGARAAAAGAPAPPARGGGGGGARAAAAA